MDNQRRHRIAGGQNSETAHAAAADSVGYLHSARRHTAISSYRIYLQARPYDSSAPAKEALRNFAPARLASPRSVPFRPVPPASSPVQLHRRSQKHANKSNGSIGRTVRDEPPANLVHHGQAAPSLGEVQQITASADADAETGAVTLSRGGAGSDRSLASILVRRPTHRQQPSSRVWDNQRNTPSRAEREDDEQARAEHVAPAARTVPTPLLFRITGCPLGRRSTMKSLPRRFHIGAYSTPVPGVITTPANDSDSSRQQPPPPSLAFPFIV